MVAAVVLLLILALAFGGVGIAGGLTWLLIIAAVLLIAGLFTGYRGYYGDRGGHAGHHHHHA
ncbi:MAG TPA: hypothetical protein VFA34_00485 [Actinomycetota bacterium]|jgi:hypothetical protein|nr:hypothetical protein [Actinomycetota bacterium]